MKNEFYTWYHGTSKENAIKILDEGFNADTWFAVRLFDVIASWPETEIIFSVSLPYKPKTVLEGADPTDIDTLLGTNWQAHILHSISKEHIIDMLDLKEFIRKSVEVTEIGIKEIEAGNYSTLKQLKERING